MNSSAGFKIKPFGKGRNAIQSAYANELVDCLNPLGNIKLTRGKEDKVFYSDVDVTIQLETDSGAGLGADSSNPFRIYQTTSWLKYKVTTGIVISTSDPITLVGAETEQTLTGGVTRYWFYLDMTSTTAEIKKSATTLTWSANLIPIGWVDTSTGIGTSTATIYQVLKDHVFNPCA
jgi:hypothetical protein